MSTPLDVDDGRGSRARWLLRRALSVVGAKDAAPFRQSVFEDLARHRPAVRLARAAYRIARGTPLASLMVAGYGLRSFLAVAPPPTRAPILTIAAYRNEQRQLSHLASLLGDGALASLDIHDRTLVRRASLGAALAVVRDPHTTVRSLRLIDRWCRRHDFLVACRLASTLGYYLRFQRILPASGARAVLVSSDSNPYAMALCAAARTHSMSTIYVTHGHIPDGPPRLDFDLSLLDGPAVLEVYRESGPIGGRVVFKGAEGAFRPIRTEALRHGRPLALGVFLSLVTDWPRLARMLDEIRRTLRPRHLLVRFHPNELVRPRDARSFVGDAEVSLGDRVLLDDASRCDLAIAANSSCHLTALKFGVPSVHLRGLDAVPHDFYRFLRHRIVPECERVADIQPSRIASFFEDPSWERRFAFFDASYPRSPREADVRAALDALVPGLSP